MKGPKVLNIQTSDYQFQKFELLLEGHNITLGNIYLERDVTLEKTDNLISLTEADLSDDTETLSTATGLLQATKDLFLSRAAFDFGQAFFRVRGYDSREGQVYLNGILMNKFFDGRPQWNNWGGLNDVIRNQEFTNGLEAQEYGFGGILGNTNIDLRPSGMRPGLRISSSLSNRSYTGRVMATYNSGDTPGGFTYTLSASRRWAKEGYMDGTLYDAYSFFVALEYQKNPKSNWAFTSILAKNRRGRSSAITEEVSTLAGNHYNPYWGLQNGKIRNSRERRVFEPILMLNHFYNTPNLKVTTGLAYQLGTNARSRLGYFDAPNPDPTYFRYLPSFYINNPVGADFTNAALAREGFLENKQINWEQLYTSNSNPENSGKAAYVLFDDMASDTQWTFSTAANLKLNTVFRLQFGGYYRSLKSQNYAKILDLLGAEFHQDMDPFSATQNDVEGELNKVEEDIFNYHYTIDASEWSAFSQLQWQHRQWSGFFSGTLLGIQYQRQGIFQNERFPETSRGGSEAVAFFNYGLKGGLLYQLTARHWISINSGYLNRPPMLQNVFINPRENNQLVPDLQSEQLSTIDVNYFIRWSKITGRLTGLYTRFQNTTDVNFFFVDAGVGSDFVQEVITHLDTLHKGLELGLEYQASPSVTLSVAANLGQYEYASNPNVSINFDTAGPEEDLINPEGNVDLGRAAIKDLKLARGPQTAFAFGVEYRDPKYWWTGVTANYLAHNYANISTITRTSSFALNPDTGQPFLEATPENISQVLRQQPLENIYLLNLVGGKSWLINGKYISLFASVNNAFDQVFRTGGYEQSRNGNFGQLRQDNLRNDPSFAPKYWYGFGRTFFINLAISF